MNGTNRMNAKMTVTMNAAVKTKVPGPFHGPVLNSAPARATTAPTALMRIGTWLAGAALVSAMAGCAVAPATPAQAVRYDLGVEPSSTLSASSSLPPPVSGAGQNAALAPPLLKVVAVTAPSALDNDRIHYRLAYANALESRSYGASRWTATPAQMMTDRLRSALTTKFRVLDGGDSERAPLLKVELIDFSQRFNAPGESQGVVTVRASLKSGGKLLAQREFGASVPSTRADAEGGATAIAAATDHVMADILAWLGHID